MPPIFPDQLLTSIEITLQVDPGGRKTTLQTNLNIVHRYVARWGPIPVQVTEPATEVNGQWKMVTARFKPVEVSVLSRDPISE